MQGGIVASDIRAEINSEDTVYKLGGAFRERDRPANLPVPTDNIPPHPFGQIADITCDRKYRLGKTW